jgi:tRNA(His) guanylyltransferase
LKKKRQNNWTKSNFIDLAQPSTSTSQRQTNKQTPRFADLHGFAKPNDDRALRLMDTAASDVALTLGAAGKKKSKESGDGTSPSSSPPHSPLSSGVVLGFGTSDEYSFVLGPSCQIYDRREAKLVSVTASAFAAAYVRRWDSFFCPGRRRRTRPCESSSNGDGRLLYGAKDDSSDTPLRSTPSFDCRAVLYPTAKHLRDYLSWRQADAHVNCQFNAAFWALVHSDGKSKAEAAAALQGTRTADKNELLFRRGINYSKLPARHRKGSVLVRRADVLDAETEEIEGDGEADVEGGEEEGEERVGNAAASSSSSSSLVRLAPGWAVVHCDIIKDDFWEARPHLIRGE